MFFLVFPYSFGLPTNSQIGALPFCLCSLRREGLRWESRAKKNLFQAFKVQKPYALPPDLCRPVRWALFCGTVGAQSALARGCVPLDGGVLWSHGLAASFSAENGKA